MKVKLWNVRRNLTVRATVVASRFMACPAVSRCRSVYSKRSSTRKKIQSVLRRALPGSAHALNPD